MGFCIKIYFVFSVCAEKYANGPSVDILWLCNISFKTPGSTLSNILEYFEVSRDRVTWPSPYRTVPCVIRWPAWSSVTCYVTLEMMHYELSGMLLILCTLEKKESIMLGREDTWVFSGYWVISNVLRWAMFTGCVCKVRIRWSVTVRFVQFSSLYFDIKRLHKNTWVWYL